MILTSLQVLAAAVVLFRCVCIAAHLDRNRFPVLWRFAGLSLAYPLMGGGAFAIVAGHQFGPALLLIGVALKIICDRRNPA